MSQHAQEQHLFLSVWPEFVSLENLCLPAISCQNGFCENSVFHSPSAEVIISSPRLLNVLLNVSQVTSLPSISNILVFNMLDAFACMYTFDFILCSPWDYAMFSVNIGRVIIGVLDDRKTCFSSVANGHLAMNSSTSAHISPTCNTYCKINKSCWLF